MKRIDNWFRKAMVLIAFLFMTCVITALILLFMELVTLIICHLIGVAFNPWPVVVCLLTILIIGNVLISLRIRAVYGGFRAGAKALIDALLEERYG